MAFRRQLRLGLRRATQRLEFNLLWQGDAGLILQSSTALETDWTDLPNANSPLLLTPGEPDPRRFFRLSQ